MVEHSRNNIWWIQTAYPNYFSQEILSIIKYSSITLALEMSVEDSEEEGLNQYSKYTRLLFFSFFLFFLEIALAVARIQHRED